MSGSEQYFKDVCDRYIDWFGNFIEKVKKAEARGATIEKEAMKMDKENNGKREISAWINKIDRQIENEMDEWTKERLGIEKAAYVRALKEIDSSEETPIYETLKPNEGMFISKNRNGILVAYNRGGTIDMERIPYPSERDG